MNRRLVRRAPLQIVVADQLHVAGFGAVTARRLRRRGPGDERCQREPEENHRKTSWQGSHDRLLSACAVVSRDDSDPRADADIAFRARLKVRAWRKPAHAPTLEADRVRPARGPRSIRGRASRAHRGPAHRCGAEGRVSQLGGEQRRIRTESRPSVGMDREDAAAGVTRRRVRARSGRRTGAPRRLSPRTP